MLANDIALFVSSTETSLVQIKSRVENRYIVSFYNQQRQLSVPTANIVPFSVEMAQKLNYSPNKHSGKFYHKLLNGGGYSSNGQKMHFDGHKTVTENQTENKQTIKIKIREPEFSEDKIGERVVVQERNDCYCVTMNKVPNIMKTKHESIFHPEFEVDNILTTKSCYILALDSCYKILTKTLIDHVSVSQCIQRFVSQYLDLNKFVNRLLKYMKENAEEIHYQDEEYDSDPLNWNAVTIFRVSTKLNQLCQDEADMAKYLQLQWWALEMLF
ncbi:Hypothetical_protein [Hexamita inflata]|uniref:Hypothetical_protein n=1 Tax=Hexamita inflata TaxID=28002 RepID=A0AA86U8D0_9EUKA|nr:Hypothetical protein HINF_LOCUS34800 [Hexamita inflata]